MESRFYLLLLKEIITSRYINLVINYLLRRIKDKLVPRKGLALKGNLVSECKGGNIS